MLKSNMDQNLALEKASDILYTRNITSVFERQQ